MTGLFMMPGLLLSFVLLFSVFSLLNCNKIDPNGYIVYCPCMGRFGNQADHFLGALGFAHGLNRTLVLPHWVEYRLGEAKSLQVPFDAYFLVEPLKEYHRVVTMDYFMKHMADQVWPLEERTSFCYVARGNSANGNKSCNAKEGNPFGPFWDTFSIDFLKSEFYAPLHYEVYTGSTAEKWKLKYPSDKWPVLAFTGAPASFPVQSENRGLHRYLQWNDNIKGQALSFVKHHFKKGGFIGIHLRNGPDWARACDHVAQSPSLFAAPQCIGYRQEHGPITYDMCLPTKYTIIRQLKRLLKNMKDVKFLYVASDADHMVADLTQALARHPVEVHRMDTPEPHLDLAILAMANHFVGNCISSYSAFVKRERDVRGLPSSFWAFPTEKKSQSSHDEL